MIAAVLRGMRHMGRQWAARGVSNGGGGCGIHFDANGMQFVRVTRTPGGDRLRLDAYGAAALEDDMLRGALIVKPEAVARRLDELLERLGTRAAALQDDAIVLALPSHGLKTQVIDCPADLPPRALRAWCQHRAALLLPGDGDPDLRSRVGVAWAEPGSHRLRLYACEATPVDDRMAVLEMSGLRAQAIDAAHQAGRRAFLWAQRAARRTSTSNERDTFVPDASTGKARSGGPGAFLQIDAQTLDLAVFDGAVCVGDVRERFDGVRGHPEALASVVRDLTRALPVAPRVIDIATQGASPAELAAICDAVASACDMAVRPFDPLATFEASDPAAQRQETFVPRAALAVPCGLALRAMSMQGVACE
ncbi:type IV pilus biogenesis protein PilM [Pandoraea sp. NPDC090278]|uniref:type IV pilus biogenesis protein PilM n=1 Tax=Pandoraea sp. NPDC090278 TaxID=3364391 RepID=UPI00383AD733